MNISKEELEALTKTALVKSSIDDLKQIGEANGKNGDSTSNQEALRLLQGKLSTEDYNEFFNNLKD